MSSSSFFSICSLSVLDTGNLDPSLPPRDAIKRSPHISAAVLHEFILDWFDFGVDSILGSYRAFRPDATLKVADVGGLGVYIGAQPKKNNAMKATGDAHLVLGFLWATFLRRFPLYEQCPAFYPTPYPGDSFRIHLDWHDWWCQGMTTVANRSYETGLRGTRDDSGGNLKLGHHKISLYC